jgi:hypothetical protein
VGPGEPLEQGRHLAVGEHRGQALRPPSPCEVAEGQALALEHLAVEEDQGVERQVLGARRDLPMHSQMFPEGADLGIPQLLRVSVLIEADEAHDPVQIGLLGADREAPRPRHRARPLQDRAMGRPDGREGYGIRRPVRGQSLIVPRRGRVRRPQVPCRRLPMGRVHLTDPSNPDQFQPHPCSIGRLAHLPTLDPGLSAQLGQVGVHVSGGLLGQFAPGMGRDILLGPYHEPTVEGRLST